MARVYLKGYPKLKKQMAKLRKETAPMVRPVMEQMAQRIVDLMKRYAPVGTPRRAPAGKPKLGRKGGELRDSIGWTWGDAPKGSIAVSSVGKGKLKITIFAGNEDVYWARWAEFGTRPHTAGGKFKGADHPGGTARPFFFPAYRSLRKETKKAFRDGVNAAVKKIVRSA